MCGEHVPRRIPAVAHRGSSPHVRGAPVRYRWHDRGGGIIPACAGSTSIPSRSTPNCRDHPRMCGEHKRRDALKVVSRGSSPHVRGAQTEVLCLGGDGGIIPACAGSTVPGNRLVGVVGDHPRMCGEHEEAPHGTVAFVGSSPHVRGALGLPILLGRGTGIIPACAGSTVCERFSHADSGDHPRMCGEHRQRIPLFDASWGSSPHVRGALQRCPFCD